MNEHQDCPKCGFSGTPLLKNGLHECPQCGIFFEKYRYLDPADGREESIEPPTPVWPWFISAGTAVFTVIAASVGLRFDGPSYLIYFGLLIVITLTAATIIRKIIYDGIFVSLIFLLCVEIVGSVRIITGLMNGMHEFGFLISLMILSGVIFFFRTSHLTAGKGKRGTGGGCYGCGGCSGGGGCGGCSG